MSSTRRAKPGSPMRQERFASSAAFSQRLLGNLVARRCAALQSPGDRKLIYFLHELSLRDGFAGHHSCNLFPAWPWGGRESADENAFRRVARELIEFWPNHVTGTQEQARKEIAEFLPVLCLDPTRGFGGAMVKRFSDLISVLREYKVRFENAILSKVAAIQVSELVFETLDFALTQRGMVLIEGSYRSGKSFSAQAWCQTHLGEARYASLASSGSDAAFYREIARSVGVACSMQMKAAEMRVRIEETLRGQELLLCLDEADYIWPQSTRVIAPPERVNWIMTGLVNHGIAVALIGSRNFTRLMRNVESRCPVWGSEQFHGRLKLRKDLPETLSKQDLIAVARILAPEADDPTILLMVGHAMRSKGYVATLESVILRAKFFAAKSDRILVFDDVEQAIAESAPPNVRGRTASAPRALGGTPLCN